MNPQKLIAPLATFILLICTVSASATVQQFAFAGVDSNGIATAEMSITISGSTLTLVLKNTSPTTYGAPPSLNIPAITGFGFDLVNYDSISLLNWQLSAYPLDSSEVDFVGNSPVIIGQMTPTPSELDNDGDWEIATSLAGVQLDFLPQVSDMSDGRIYNPDVAADLSPGNGKDAYLTTATLVMEFDSTPGLLLNLNSIAGGNNPSPFVRFQSVGNGGSLKLNGTPIIDDDEVGAVPEPATIVVWSLLAVCSVFGCYRRRK